jgi:hypothetical protein
MKASATKNPTCGRSVESDTEMSQKTVLLDGLGKTKIIAELVKYCIVSAHVKRDIAPLSLMLIAPTENNKTRILLKFADEKRLPKVKVIENLSGKPLNKLVREQDQKQTVNHIIVLDFIRTLEAKSSVVQAVTGTLLNLVDEGCKESLYYGQRYKLKRRVQIGLITGITPPLFKKHFGRWNQNGAMTRFLFCSYRYSEATVQEIQRFIAEDLPLEVKATIAKIRNRGIQDIQINNPDIAAAIMILTEDLKKRLKTFYVKRHVGKETYKVYLDMEGFRLQKMLRLLAKSIAYDAGRNEVNYEDLAKLRELVEFIHLPDNPKEI